jgi:co-chaperonin GroES (HSP10)
MKLNKDLVLIRVEPPKEQDDSGIFIQEEWVARQPIGVVEATAPNVEFCKVGDKVWFERYTAIPHPIDKDLRACREDAIIEVL